MATTLQEFYEGLEKARQAGDIQAYEQYINEQMSLNRMCCGRISDIDIAGNNELGLLYMAMKKMPEAINYLETALNLTRRAAGENTIEYASALRNLADAKHKSGDTKDALAKIKVAIDILKSLGAENTDFYGFSLSDAAMYSFALGDVESSCAYSLMSAETAEKIGKSPVDCAVAFGNLGMVCLRAGKKNDAKNALERAIAYADQVPEAKNHFAPLYQALESLQ